MLKGNYIWDQMKEHASYGEGAVVSGTIMEVAGDNRVLIENHLGILSYGNERINVKVKYGFISICGCNLEMTQMTKEHLVILGKINSISLHRRGER